MSEASSASLRSAIEAALPDRPFALRFWDGGVVASTRPGPTLTFTSPEALGHVIRSPGELGLGRAYVHGLIEVDDLDGVIALLGRWQAPPLSAATKARIGAAALRAYGLRRLPGAPAAELQPGRKRHSRERDAEVVRHHYDVSNDFFKLFLDESMTYSCALWEDAETLEEAQRAKLDLICRKVELDSGMRMLDIGCGWGALGIHAAREYGASVLGITLSPPQAEEANRRAREAGVGERCEFVVRDYRDLADDEFDAVASIGMVEHVGGSQADEYGRQVARVLRPGGKVLNHGIAWVPPTDQGFHIGGDFSERYVFPDGEVQNLSRMLLSLERAGLETLHVENLHNDYAETLRHWTARLDENLEEGTRIAGEERMRVWRLYLRAARNGFETGQTAVYQMLCSAPLTEPPSPAPTGRRHGEARRRVPA